MSTVQLRGGLETKSQDSAGSTNGKKKERKLADARATLEKIRKGMPQAAINLKPRGKEAVLDDGRLKAADLIKYVDDYAKEVFHFVVVVARPFMRASENDAELGEEVWDDLCPDGAQTIRSRYEDYAGTISAVRSFEPDSDGTLHEQAAFNGREEFIAKLCGRVRQMAELAVLYDLLLYAPDKPEMDRLMEDSGDAEGSHVFQCLGRSAEKAPIYAFGCGWKVRDDAFGQYHDLAVEKLKESVVNRSRQLAEKNSKAVQAEQNKLKETRSFIPVEDLLFGNPAEVNGKTAVIRWEHERRENAIVVRRQDKALVVESVAGVAEKNFRDLQAMNKDCGLKSVMVMVFNIADDKTGMLVAKKGDGKYVFHIRTPDVVDDEDARAWWNATFYLTLWIRTGCQSCVSPARIPEPVAAVARPAEKPAPAVRQPAKTAEAQKPLSVDDGDESTELSVDDFRKTRKPGRIQIRMAQWAHKFADQDGKLTGEEVTVKDLMVEFQRFRGPEGEARIRVNDFSPEHQEFLDKVGVLSPDGMPEHWLPPFVRNLLKTDFAMKRAAARAAADSQEGRQSA